MTERDPRTERWRRDPRPRARPGAGESSVFGQGAAYGDDGWPWEDRASGYRDPYSDQRSQPGQPGQYPPGQPGQYPPGQYPPGQYPPGQRPPPGRPGGGPRRRPGAPGREPSAQRRPSPDRPGPRLPVGAGALVGMAGLTCFLLALTVLPWFTAGGRDVALSDIRTAFTIPETDASGLLPDSGEEAPLISPDDIPSPEQVAGEVEERARDAAAEAAASAIDTGKSRYLELYTETLWMVVAGAVALSVVFSTILTPRSLALSVLLGFRGIAIFVTMLAGAAHGAALWVVFSGDGAPDPAFGVWLGVGGLGAVLLGCILGPKRR